MAKRVEVTICPICESEYKLAFVAEEVSGYPKFCPFCGSEAYDEEHEEEDYDNDD